MNDHRQEASEIHVTIHLEIWILGAEEEAPEMVHSPPARHTLMRHPLRQALSAVEVVEGEAEAISVSEVAVVAVEKSMNGTCSDVSVHLPSLQDGAEIYHAMAENRSLEERSEDLTDVMTNADLRGWTASERWTALAEINLLQGWKRVSRTNLSAAVHLLCSSPQHRRSTQID